MLLSIDTVLFQVQSTARCACNHVCHVAGGADGGGVAAGVGGRVPASSATPEGESTQFYGQPPIWGSCEAVIDDAGEIPTAQCGTVSVPVDYAKLEGKQAQLAVIRVPTTGERIGVLVLNPGGPGASAVDTVAGMGTAAAVADMDVVRAALGENPGQARWWFRSPTIRPPRIRRVSTWRSRWTRR